MLDLLLINPGGRETVYGMLGSDFTAIEPPLWIRLIAGYVRDRGYSVKVLDTDAESISATHSADIVKELRPRFAAICSYGHQPSASSHQMHSASELAHAIKATTPHQLTALLGGHVSALPTRTLDEEPVEFVIDGEGPLQILEMLTGTISGWPLKPLKVCIPKWPLIPVTDLHGNAWDLLPMSKYRAHNWQCLDGSPRTPYASIYTSLGCPYKCNFCCINAPFHANVYRMRDPQKVAQEVSDLYFNYGVRTLKITDEMFVLNDRHVERICRLIAAKSFAHELNLWCYARIDTIKPERLSLMRDAGIRWLALGIEAANSQVRDGAEKHLEDEEIVQTVRQIQAAGINVIGNFIFGLPHDTRETMIDTLNLAKELNCEFVNFYSAMAYPGSKLYTEALEKGWQLPANWGAYSQLSKDSTPLPTATMTSKEVRAFRDAAFHDYFSHEPYLASIARKFGPQARRHIEDMASIRLERD